MMAQDMAKAKAEEATVNAAVKGLFQLVERGAREGTAAHVVEEQLFRQVLALGRQVYGHFLAFQGTGDMGEQLTLPSGRQVQRLPKPRPRQLVTIFGEFRLERTVYGSREGQKIEAVPLDARLQLPESKFSYLLQNWDQLVTTEQPYNQVSRTMEMILGVSQHVDSLERMSRQMATSAEEFSWSQSPPPAAEEGEILVESADGKGVPIRHAADAPPIRDHVHRPGPKPDRKRMATVGAVYSVDRFVRTPEQVLEALFHDPQTPRPPDLPQRPRPQHKRTYARLDDDPDELHTQPVNGQAATFGWLDQQVRSRLARRRKPMEVVCVMDGQESLWETKAIFQPDLPTVEILDLLHVTPRLWKAAHLFHPTDLPAAEGFVREQTLLILRGRVKSVIHSLRSRATRRGLPAASRKSLAVICNYFAKNRERMRYDEYLQKGYPIASGVIEGTCRHVVKDRLERTGMSWTRDGAQALLHLRAIATSDQWHEYLTYQVQNETQRLYPYRHQLTPLEIPIAA
jgi:hypothetical protein